MILKKEENFTNIFLFILNHVISNINLKMKTLLDFPIALYTNLFLKVNRDKTLILKQFLVIYFPQTFNYFDYKDAWYYAFFYKPNVHSWFFQWSKNKFLKRKLNLFQNGFNCGKDIRVQLLVDIEIYHKQLLQM